MRKFTENEIREILQSARQGESVAALCQRYEISDSTYNAWIKQYTPTFITHSNPIHFEPIFSPHAFVSYAQNFEDVMLYRALKDVQQGFYVDVGANDPIVDSVTHAFYLRGWSGVNVEPIPSHIAALQKVHPRDINLQVAASDADGEITLFDTDVRGWSTASQDIAQTHRDHGVTLKSYLVPARTLTSIFEEYAPADVHFLKVDVEGWEESVLRGLDFNRFRPWIVVVEATLPNSQVESFADWEQVLFQHDYHFVYFDGLNRFYLAAERSQLAFAFRTPPNVFDDFVRYDLVQAWQAYDALKAQYAKKSESSDLQ